MKKRVVLLTLALVFLAGGLSDARAAAIDFALLPADGIVSGPAGSTLGWGYAITNNDQTRDLTIYGISLTTSDNVTPWTLVYDFLIVKAGSTLSESYEPFVKGLFELTWNSGLPAGTIERGFVTLYGDLLDPEDSSTFETVELSASYTATIPQAVPEPASLLLLGSGLAGLAAIRKRR